MKKLLVAIISSLVMEFLLLPAVERGFMAKGQGYYFVYVTRSWAYGKVIPPTKGYAELPYKENGREVHEEKAIGTEGDVVVIFFPESSTDIRSRLVLEVYEGCQSCDFSPTEIPYIGFRWNIGGSQSEHYQFYMNAHAVFQLFIKQ